MAHIQEIRRNVDTGQDVILYEFWDNGNVYHRLDGPAYITYTKDGKKHTEMYYINGKYHRVNGPAYMEYDIDGNVIVEVHYLLDVPISVKDFNTPGFIDVFIMEHS